MTKADLLYVLETNVWLKQQSLRLNDCRNIIDSLQNGISLDKKLIKLYQQQAKLIKKRKACDEKTLREYLATKLKKSAKSV